MTNHGFTKDAGETGKTFGAEFHDVVVERVGEDWFAPEQRRAFLKTCEELCHGPFKQKLLTVVSTDDIEQGFGLLFRDSSMMTFCSADAEDEIKERARANLRALRAVDQLFDLLDIDPEEFVREGVRKAEEEG